MEDEKGTTEASPQTALQNAAEHADLGLPVAADERHRLAKRAIARLSRRLTTHQAAFNRAILETVRGQQRALEELVARVDALTGAVEGLGADRREELGRWRADDAIVQMVVREVREGASPRAAVEAVVDRPDGRDQFYADFEDRFRGSDELIRTRLAAYVPDVAAVASLGRVLDIGTGRGEFLGLLAEAGIDAYGVDTNSVTVAECRARGLDVVEADALDHLRDVPDASLAVVAAFHLVEHLPFEWLLDLADHATRVLKPGGLLILETPNPSNLIVGAVNFYIDPTHLRPIPPPLLHMVLWSRGFDPIEIRYVNPPGDRFEVPEGLGEAGDAVRSIVERLNDILFAPCDYGIIGRRVGAEAAGADTAR
jgi:SAM-dependent methyltransferase